MDEFSRPLGHSNASLFASADEMAGTYSPQNDTHNIAPVRNTPVYRAQRGGGAAPNSQPRIDTKNMELHYPMPEKAEVWHQAEHPDTIHKVLNYEGDISMETFRGAAKMFSHANPEQFLLPLESRIICMKVDRMMDMKYALANGAVTNLPSCNERITAVWDERDGERVFMMFSISGQKEFCAMAEMITSVQTGSLPGWSKPGCTGVILLTFIYVKNVPFSLVNHIKHKANGQPVANMWNSMMYHDNTGYHVAKIYCEHPVLSSLLITYRTELQNNYKSQLRIPTSGSTVYSGSSYSSRNNKAHDPRSATRVTIHRSGNRDQRSGASRDAAQRQSWRRNDTLPTPPRYQPQIGGTPTQVATHRRGMLQSGTNRVLASPPHFAADNTFHGPTPGVNSSARSFVTADDRMLAEFAESRGAKRSDAGSASSENGADQQTANVRVGPSNYRGAIQDGRSSRVVHHHTPPPPLNTKWRGAEMDTHDNYQGPYKFQWQKNGRGAQVPVLTNGSPPGLGIRSADGNASEQLSLRTAPLPIHLPSPATSSQPSNTGSFPQADELRRHTSQNLPAPSTSLVHSGLPQNHARPAPKFSHHTFPGCTTNGFIRTQHNFAKAGNPMKHSQSMPVMVPHVAQRISAQNLRAQAASFEPGNLGGETISSPSIHHWVIETPSRTAFATEQSPSSSSSSNVQSLAITNVAAAEYSPDKSTTITRHLNMEQKLEWHKARVEMLEVEVEMSHSTPDIEACLKWQRAKVRMLEIDIIAAHKEHEEARGDLAQPTDDHPPQSPGTAHSSADWPKRAKGSSVESALITPEVDENGKICRSVSKNRLDKPTHIGQKLRHRRGTINTEGFTGSFDARMNANVEGLVASPTYSGAYPIELPTPTHGHPPQQYASTRFSHGNPEIPADQIDSCTEDQRNRECEHYSSESHQFTSPASIAGNDDDVFSPRGRGYPATQSPPTRDVSQMSYNGGIWLEDKRGYGYQ